MEAKDGKPFQSAKGSSDLGCQIVRLYDCVLEQSLIFTSLVTVYIYIHTCRQDDASIEDVVLEGRLLLECLKLQAEVVGLRVLPMYKLFGSSSFMLFVII